MCQIWSVESRILRLSSLLSDEEEESADDASYADAGFSVSAKAKRRRRRVGLLREVR
jgi:hypothetical protein